MCGTLEEMYILTVADCQPEDLVNVLDQLLPTHIDFYRTPITLPQSAETTSSSVPATSDAPFPAKDGPDSSSTQPISIYGSVSTSDIVANVRALLVEDPRGAAVVLEAGDVHFVEKTEENLVRHLGTFEVEIKLKGAMTPVRRIIRVNVQS